MKAKYLNELKELLQSYQMEVIEIQEILEDYGNMFDDGVSKGMTDEEVIEYLGKPKSNIKDLTEGYKKVNKVKDTGREKIIAISPFVATIIFVTLGLGFDLWHPGWMVFTLIPITAIIVELGTNRDKHIFVSLSPFVASLVFLYLGLYLDLWHPGWLVFTIIPVIAIITERNTMKFLELLTALSPFVALVLFFYLGNQGEWHPGWLVFMIIPIIGALNEKSIIKMFIIEFLLIGGVAIYLYVGYEIGEWTFALCGFLPIILYAIYNGNINIVGIDGDRKIRYISVATVTLLIITGLLIGNWDTIWMILFIIPVCSILFYSPKESHLVAISPFVAFAIFFSLGMFGGYWEFSWLAFMIIPMVAIIKEV